MYAYRSTWIMKPGCNQKALELNKEWAQKGLFGDSGRIRCYTPSTSPNLFVFEVVAESHEARNQLYAEFSARPEAKVYWEKWWELAERWVGNEGWEVTELG